MGLALWKVSGREVGTSGIQGCTGTARELVGSRQPQLVSPGLTVGVPRISPCPSEFLSTTVPSSPVPSGVPLPSTPLSLCRFPGAELMAQNRSSPPVVFVGSCPFCSGLCSLLLRPDLHPIPRVPVLMELTCVLDASVQKAVRAKAPHGCLGQHQHLSLW